MLLSALSSSIGARALQVGSPEYATLAEGGQVCIASIATAPAICPGFDSNPPTSSCNPNSIFPGDDIEIEIYVDNLSQLADGDPTSSNLVEAELTTNSSIELFLTCEKNYYQKGVTEMIPLLVKQSIKWHKECQNRTHEVVWNPGWENTADNLRRCEPRHAHSCGMLKVEQAINLGMTGLPVCIGKITGKVNPTYAGGNSFFYTRAETGPIDAEITDPRCLNDLTGGGQGSTVAVLSRHPSPPLSPPPSPPLAPPPGMAQDPHIHFAHGGRADFRGRHRQLYNFLSAPGLSVNLRTENCTFPLGGEDPPRLIVDGSFITEVHLVVRVGANKSKWANISYWSSELNEDNWGWKVVNGSCDGRRTKLGKGGFKRCEVRADLDVP